MNQQKFTFEYEGKPITIEVGRLAQQANAAVTIQFGETIILATVNMSKSSRDVDFFPLMVDYEEKYYAAGRIKGPRYLKREGRPTEDAVLNGRMIDRGLRPRFPQNLRNDIQVICTPLSFDGVNKPDVLAMLAAATALHISDIPFNGPVAAVRIGRINGEFIINPTVEELEQVDLELIVQGDGEQICMVDCDAQEIKDEDLVLAFAEAMRAMAPIIEFMNKLRAEIGIEKVKAENLLWATDFTDEELKLVNELKQMMLPHLDKFLFNTPKGSKGERKLILDGLKELVINDSKGRLVNEDRNEAEAEKYLKDLIDKFFIEFIEEQVSLNILNSDRRVDGRKLDEIRELKADVGFFERLHGTGLFSRGETQVLSVVTLGAPGDQLSLENMEEEGTKKYFHHYNFPPYCVGEVKPLRGAGRREIGHGALAEKALRPMLPDELEFPYTIRVVSEVMSSNGSSSMASTCSSTLALMDAGIPIKKPVSGIAMGLASEGGRWKILTDLQDLEDGPGGMDFKLTSTRDGITAVQMDCKSTGLKMDIIKGTIHQARQALDQILNTIETAIPTPRVELSEYAPRIITIMINPEKIASVIGPGGKVVRELQDRFEVQIDIQDEGQVLITSTNKENAEGAKKEIAEIVREVAVGDVFEEAIVVKIISIGAFVKLTPGTDGMLRISELDYEYVEKITDKVNVGDKIKVKVIKIERGKVEVSMKALLTPPPGYVERKPSYNRDRRDGGGRSGGYGRRDSRGPPRQSSDQRERRY